MTRLLVLWPLLIACSKSEPPPPERTEPWPAPGVAASGSATTSGASQPWKVRIDDRCELAVELPARESTPRGVLRVARGSVEVDLLNLERTRGTIEIDVASIDMQSEADGSADTWDTEAKNWLDVGANRPEAERERHRWASYEITAVDNLSAVAAHEGKRRPASDADAGGEERVVNATLTGQLSLHGFRIERALRVRAIFGYAAPAVRGATPNALRVELARPLSFGLAAHDIKPRDDSGVVLAQQMKWLGVRVGKDAKVTGFLSALPVR